MLPANGREPDGGQWPPAAPSGESIPDATHPAAEIRVVTPVQAAPPDPKFDVRTFGAKGDGQTFDTVAIQKAINAASGTGGSVILAGGRFLTAPLTLKGKMTFYVSKDATLLGSTLPQDYPDQLPRQTAAPFLRKSLLFADGADFLVIDGGGVIDGQGQLLKMGGKEPFRPSLLRIFSSNHVTVRNLTLQNPRMWTDIYSECTDLTLDHLHVIAPAGYCENLDGRDVCDCRGAKVTNCRIEAQDDGICLKSHGSRGLQDVWIENNEITDFGANGIKLGTATAGPISGIHILNNVVHAAKFGGLCIESVDGSQVRNIEVRGLEMQRVAEPVFVRLALRKANPNLPVPPPGAAMPKAGKIERVSIEEVRATQVCNGPAPSNTITGVPFARVSDVVIRNGYFEMPGGLANQPPSPPEIAGGYPQSNIFGNPPGYGFYVRHADHVIFDHVTTVTVKTDARPWLAKERRRNQSYPVNYRILRRSAHHI